MKVLLISPLPPPNGGMGTWTKKYLAYCKDFGIEADIVDTAPIGRRGVQLNTKRKIKDEIVRTYRIFIHTTQFLKRVNYDVVHLNTSCDKFGLYRDYLLAKIIKKYKKKLVVHFHCNLDFQINRYLRKKIYKRLAFLANKMIVLNKQSFEFAVEYGNKKTYVMPNFIEEKYLNNGYIVRNTVRRVIFVGHVQFSKGFREIYVTAQQFPDIEFVLVGPVCEEVKSYKKLPNMVYKGEMTFDGILPELRASDLFLFPSYTEGFSNALLEAMACGLPIIASNVGANEDMIGTNGGIIVPVKNINAIVSAIYSMKSFDKRRKMSEWNLKKVRSQYILPAFMEELLKLYLTS